MNRDYGLETWVSYVLEQDTAGDANLVAGYDPARTMTRR